MVSTSGRFNHLSWHRIDISFTFVLAAYDSPNGPDCKVYFVHGQVVQLASNLPTGELNPMSTNGGRGAKNVAESSAKHEGTYFISGISWPSNCIRTEKFHNLAKWSGWRELMRQWFGAKSSRGLVRDMLCSHSPHGVKDECSTCR